MSTNQWVEKVNRDDVVEIGKQLVSIPSVSGDEYEIMQFVKRWLDERGISYCVLRPPRSEATNIIATVGNPDQAHSSR
ncbi:MAG: hypothetical protein M9950_04005 [Thermomicrobiales bacterium]|nr:hypothetical protein [Thermomicrobiales bacterium]